ncbi:MAG TPA: peptidoglycan-binding protein [Pseudonocardiaceae bacterium]
MRRVLLLMVTMVATLVAAAVVAVPPASAAAAVWPTVQQGATGPNVQSIQFLLTYRGIAVATDGVFGTQTRSAVVTFQQRNGLVADGVVGPQTWPVLVTELRQGMSGNHVRAGQVALNQHGYGLAVDGQFGPATDAAVRNFQQRRGLLVDGLVGPATWRELVGVVSSGGGPLPVPRSSITRGDLDNPHHDYPAIDIMVRYVPAYAMMSGTVVHFSSTTCGLGLRLNVGGSNRINYCHLSSRSVANGATVTAGMRIGTTGETGNAAGNPHLHIEIRTDTSAGILRCPQPWLLAVYDGRTPPALTSLPTTGCFF